MFRPCMTESIHQKERKRIAAAIEATSPVRPPLFPAGCTHRGAIVNELQCLSCFHNNPALRSEFPRRWGCVEAHLAGRGTVAVLDGALVWRTFACASDLNSPELIQSLLEAWPDLGSLVQAVLLSAGYTDWVERFQAHFSTNGDV